MLEFSLWPSAGISYSIGIRMTMSGSRPDGWVHPSVNVGSAGASPIHSGAPASAQAARVSISSCVSVISFRKLP